MIVEDLVPFIELCTNGDLDDDELGANEDEEDLDEVVVEDWVDSDEEEPEIKNAPSGIQEPERRYPDWFIQLPKPAEPVQTKKFFKIKNRDCVGRIISWKYDSDNKVIMIKRTDGIQYFSRSFKRLSSLPKCEVNHIAQIRMINRSGDGMMRWFEDMMYREYKNEKFVMLKETFPRRKIDYFDIHPITNLPRVKLIYKKAQCKKKIPLEKVPYDFTKFIHFWQYNGMTGEAEIVCYDKEPNVNILYQRKVVIYVYDPLSLINMSESDLEALSTLGIVYNEEDKDQALQFQRVADVCCSHRIHAGRGLPRS